MELRKSSPVPSPASLPICSNAVARGAGSRRSTSAAGCSAARSGAFIPTRPCNRKGSTRLADKTALQFLQSTEGGGRQRALSDRARGVFELIECRIADEHGRHRVIGNSEAQCCFD